jgi:hypothetical protein
MGCFYFFETFLYSNVACYLLAILLMVIYAVILIIGSCRNNGDSMLNIDLTKISEDEFNTFEKKLFKDVI